MLEQFGPDLVLLQKIDAGGMAEVFRARLIGTGGFEKIVAVKRILPHFAMREDFRERFQREMNLVAKLQHPNIVQVFKNGERDDFLYLVMEFVNGKNLANLVYACKQQGLLLPVPFVCFIVLEVARGLEYAHGFCEEQSGKPLNVIHRDVNPANVMISYRGEVKLVDFGIARAAGQEQMTQMGDLKGTIPYCSPEQVEGLKLDLRTDIFSLGVVFWELLTGARLFEAASSFEIIRRIRDCNIPSVLDYRDDVDPELVRILEKVLARDRNARYQTDEEFYRELVSFKNRHFPDFVASDFGAMVTTLFRDDIEKELERRRSGGEPGPKNESLVAHETAVLNSPVDYSTVLVQGGKTGVHLLRPDRMVLASLALVVCFISSAILFYPSKKNVVDSKLDLGLSATQPASALDSTFDENFSPASLPGLVSWFSARTIEESDGAHIVRWKDSLYGHYILHNPGATHQSPTFRTSVAGGKPAIEFDGKNDYLIGDELVETLQGTRTFSIVFVGAITKDIRRQYVVSMHQADKEGDVLRLGYAKGLRVHAFSDPTRKKYETGESGEIELDQLHIVTCIFDIERGKIFLNGKPELNWPIKHLNGMDLAKTFSVGMEWDRGRPTDFFNGYLSELFIFNRSLLDFEREGLERTLLRIYNIPH